VRCLPHVCGMKNHGLLLGVPCCVHTRRKEGVSPVFQEEQHGFPRGTLMVQWPLCPSSKSHGASGSSYVSMPSDLAQGHLRRRRYDRPPAPHPNPDPNPTLPCRRQRRSRTRCGALSQTAARRSLWACRSSCSRPCTTPLASTPSPSPDDQSSRACACAQRPHASRGLLSDCAGVPASLLPGGLLRCCACMSQCES